MRAPDSASLQAGIEAAVREAGALAVKFRENSPKSWNKHGGSPVSEADIAVDNFLRDRLMRLAPDCGWLSEETEDDRARLSAPRIWVVDPIDGTRAYLSGRDDWSISVALVENGRPVIATLFAPMLDALYAASAGTQTTRNGIAVTANAGESLHGIKAAGPKPMLERLARHAPDLTMEPKVFSLALRLTRVAAGTLDLAFASHNSHDWDLAAADLLVHEAGGVMTALDGGTLVYNRPDPVHGVLVAAGRERHAALVDLVRAQTGKPG